MATQNLERSAPLAGVAGVGLFISAVVVIGDTSSKHGLELARFYADHRTSLLVGGYLIGLGLFALLLGVWGMRAAGHER